ncbi:MAG: hypothetical protein ACRC2S_17420 [Waterburya sp.]
MLVNVSYNFQINVSLPIALDVYHQKGLEAAVKSCLIHNTLTHLPKIVTQINSI